MSAHVEPTFVVRISGLPLTVLDRMRTARTADLVDEIIDLDEWLATRGEPLADELHDVIGGIDDTTLRRRLIGLRRDVFNARAPRTGVDATLLETLPAGLAGRITQWHGRIRDRAALLAHAEAELRRESVAGRRALHEIATAPALRNGLVLASRDLLRDLDRWSPERPDAHLERKLAKYVSRMAAKTSPYSTFTGTAQGRWLPGDGGPAYEVDPRRVSVVELNAFTQQQIPRALAAWPEIRPRLPLAVNSSVVEDENVLRFLGRKDGEAVIELPRTPTLRWFLQQVRHGEDRTYGGVIRALAGLETTDRGQQIAEFLDKLIDVGLVEIGFGIPDNETDHLGALVHALEPFDGEQVASIRETLVSLRADLAGYGRLGPAERLSRSTVVARRLTSVYEQLGWDASGDNVPKNAFYEDVLVPVPGPEVPADPWRGVLDALELLRGLAGLYDRFLPGRLAAEAFFADHFGAGAEAPFLDFYRAFCQELRRPGGRISGADLATCYERAFPVPTVGLERLDRLAARQEELAAATAALPVDAAGARHLDPAWLRDFLGRLPEFVPPIESMACYVQPMMSGPGPVTAVLNELMTGFGRSQARLLRLGRRAGTAAFADPPPVSAGTVRYAEVTGTVGSNLNLKHPVTHYEISYPLSTSDRPPEQRLALSDLQVCHDPAAGMLRLVSKSHGTAIMPVHLGAMVEFLLPDAYRFLIQMFGQAVPRFEFVKHLAAAPVGDEHDGVRRQPRLVLGPLVVNRAAWPVPARDLPRLPRRGRGSALDHLLEVTRWRRRLGLPRRCFVRAVAAHGNAAGRSRVDGLFDKTRKPVYLDFASDVFLDVFEEVAASTDQLLVFEEMLPGAAESAVRQDGTAHAGEFIIELGGRP